MRLKELLADKYKRIVIQCHDNPDADALASGLGVLAYLRRHGKTARLVYSGAPIQKANLVLMVAELDIPIEHVQSLEEKPDLLLTVDCQYGEGTVRQFPAETVAVIDHHMVRNPDALTPLWEVRSNYGACAVIIWDMLCAEGFDVGADENLSTALYYGLFMDTNHLQELRHPKDRDLRDALEMKCSQAKLFLFQNCNLSLSELKIAGLALSGYCYHEYSPGHGFAVVGAEQCDPNILGIINDMLIEVDIVDASVAYCMQDKGIKLSVRSCVRETRADELAAFIAGGLGGGGGHIRKAGGLLSREALAAEYERLYNHRPIRLENAAGSIITARMEQYFLSQDVIHPGSGDQPDLSGAPLYQKKRLTIGYVLATDLYPVGTKVEVRMLEGDQPFAIEEDTYFMIGVEGEVYINKEAVFLANNEPIDTPYQFQGEYAPKIHTAVRVQGLDAERLEPKSLTDYAKACMTRPGRRIHARPVDRVTKVAVSWSDSCLAGLPGDYLASREDDPADMYIIKKDIFLKSYEPVSPPTP